MLNSRKEKKNKTKKSSGIPDPASFAKRCESKGESDQSDSY